MSRMSRTAELFRLLLLEYTYYAYELVLQLVVFMLCIVQYVYVHKQNAYQLVRARSQYSMHIMLCISVFRQYGYQLEYYYIGQLVLLYELRVILATSQQYGYSIRVVCIILCIILLQQYSVHGSYNVCIYNIYPYSRVYVLESMYYAQYAYYVLARV